MEAKNNDIVPSFAISLEEVESRIHLLEEFIKKYMIKGEDYGEIPGVSKPTLLKPGAEKLCDVYGFAKMVEVKNRVEDWEKGFFHYEVEVTLINKRNNLLEAQGVGSCNSKERKYRYQDPYTIVNTILKMAKKRALIDAVLSATRSSGIFTQDVEDMELQEEAAKPSSEKQRKFIYNLSKEKHFDEEQLRTFCSSVIGEDKPSKDWTSEEASKIISALQNIPNASMIINTH
ncbi:MAG: hypothetical protein PWP07_1489 [Epulopiscium sp.]|jgi:hypothetical protein|uniref:Uncharacterized protein n=1 Tax=Defluviitalea raffinosedens TaxID=1450156 RepID=A0A7C8HG40_9FIRM|nr:hypothetical protein [Defluviitalea raffinosedens]MBZ4669290.1 hypothetical protein [Defluviitaleaceae bacterium]MDK2788244.1 hypothetical protein [Candidatus Epulonipiscium sp.]KAE9635009.1 hypothetical protein GND95_06775 [Defluviitalea raffinosedens]MBM7686920.1 hypothetical protein [Defluviitalea raffinosedens]HHW67783.1 hypothetical protein [Candidatus Epulonipiscium sp.]